MFTSVWPIRLDFGLLILFLSIISLSLGTEYRITSTWDNRTIDHNPVVIRLEPNDDSSFTISIQAPFFNDPAPIGQPGEPFYGLWDYEVVEVFLLNDQDQYVEIELSPWGQHIVLLLNGYRQTVRHSLFIDFSANKTANQWQGRAIIPFDIVPPLVTKMNAYAIHGVGDSNRVYESLYPVAFNSTNGPDFHKLDAFQPFNWSSISTNIISSYSTVWADSLRGIRSFQLEQSWNGTVLPIKDNVNVQLETRSVTGLSINIDAPFYNDVVPPSSVSGWPSSAPISSYEVLTILLFGDHSLFLELQLSPWGHYAVGFHSAGMFNYSANTPIAFQVDMQMNRWTGLVVVPLAYLPPKVSKCNIHLSHGPEGIGRQINSLYPANPSETVPNFYSLKYDKAIDLSVMYPENENPECSSYWAGKCPEISSAGVIGHQLPPFLLLLITAFVLIIKVY